MIYGREQPFGIARTIININNINWNSADSLHDPSSNPPFAELALLHFPITFSIKNDKKKNMSKSVNRFGVGLGV